jgi:putative modified peptide
MSKKLPHDVAHKLLDRLTDDDAFRERFRRDPRGCLREIDPHLADQSEGAWMCLSGAGLPEASTLRETRDALLTQMTAGSQTVFQAGK